MQMSLHSLPIVTPNPAGAGRRGFTLIEIMIVVSIIAIFVGLGLPSFYRMLQKEGMTKAVSDVVEACSHARAEAILGATGVDLVIHPKEGTFEVSKPASLVPINPDAPAPSAAAGGLVFSSKLPKGIEIELLGINFKEMQESEDAKVHFGPNGTSDEFVVILRSDQQEIRKVSLEVITGLAQVEVIR